MSPGVKRPAPESDDEAHQGDVSPPPTQRKTRKVASTATKKAIASFFTPVSQKAPERLAWRIVNNSLLVGRYNGADGGQSPSGKRRKVAAFDFDSTLITTSSGNVFGKDASDWRWWHPCVPSRLRQLYSEGYRLAILSNQGGLNLGGSAKTAAKEKRLHEFKLKAGYVIGQLDLPISIYAATGKDEARKPRTGMWAELCGDYDLTTKGDEGNAANVILEESIFVGDAAGRLASRGIKADHSSSDRDFAANVGIRFQTPEEFFLEEEGRVWERKLDPSAYVDEATAVNDGDGKTAAKADSEPPRAFAKKNEVEILLLCGSPGSGKSTFYWTQLEPLGYERANQDQLKTREKCLKVATELVKRGTAVAVDSTNADVETRSRWIELGTSLKVNVRCVWLQAPPEVCRHNDVVRALNEKLFNPEKRTMLPSIAFAGFASKFKEPKVEEGFQDVTKIPFKFHGTDDQRKVWRKHWT